MCWREACAGLARKSVSAHNSLMPSSGHHLWAERYDREMKEVLALQDEIALKIMTALHVKLQRDDARVMGRGVKNLEAYLKAMEGRERFNRGTKEDNALARKLAQEAIALDPIMPEGTIFSLIPTPGMSGRAQPNPPRSPWNVPSN